MTNTPNDLGSCQFVLMQGSEYTAALQLAALSASGNGSSSGITVPSTPFDYELAAQFWAFGFTVALTLYFTSHVIGLILKFIREN